MATSLTSCDGSEEFVSPILIIGIGRLMPEEAVDLLDPVAPLCELGLNEGLLLPL